MIDFSPLLATHAFNDSGSRTTFLCDPTWQHSFYQISSPPWQPMLSMIQVQVQHSFYQFFPPPLATHALRPYLTTFLLSNFPPPWQPMLSMIRVRVQHPFYQFFPPPLATHLCDPTWQHSFYQIFPPLGNPCFQWFEFKYNIPFINFSPPPWQPMLCDPTWQHSFYQIFHPLGNPFFQWFKFKYNIPFMKKFPPPWQPMLCDPTWQHSFYQNFSPPPPLATHAFNDSGSSTTFLLSNFSPPPWQPMLCHPTWQHSLYQIFPPLGNPCFQWFKFKYNIPFYHFFPPPPLATHALRPYLTTFPPPPPLATHAFNDSSSSTTFLLSKFFPPLATHALRPYLTTFPPPPLATHAFNDSSSSTTFLLSKFFPPLGNPCFATLPDNIPFIKFSTPLATHSFNDSSSSTTFLLWKNFPPPRQRTARSLSTPRKTPGILFGDPTQLFYQSTMPNKDRAPQHTVQPHIASKYANAPLRHAVNEPPETSQHHAKTSSHTLLRPYPTTFSNQQGRTEVGSNNTPYSHT